MKLLMVTPRYFPEIGGVEYYAQAVCRFMHKSGVDVAVFATDASGKLSEYEVIDGLPVSRFRSLSPNEIYDFSPGLLEALMRVKDYDIVHALDYQSFPVLAAAIAKKINRTRCVITPHLGFFKVGMPLHLLYSRIGSFIIRQMEAVIITSQDEITTFRNLGIRVGRKTVYIPNGVDPEFYEIRRGSPNKKLLFVGRLEKYKGVQKILSALRDIRDDEVELLVVGDGPYRTNLEHLTRRLGLSDRVFFLGKRHGVELLKAYAECSVFALPSSYESLPLSVLQALASGMPVISTPIGGLSKFLFDGENGFIIENSENNASLVKAISDLLTDESRWRSFSSRARQRVLSLSWDNISKRILDLYARIL